MKTRLLALAMVVAPTGAAGIFVAPSFAQPQGSAPTPPPTPQPQFVWPARISNARVFPADLGANQLRATMVSFSRSLGVRCTFCHVGPEGAALTSLDFASDANPNKDVARGMVRLLRRLNGEDLPALVGASDQWRVTCFTCHRGASTPATQLPPLG